MHADNHLPSYTRISCHLCKDSAKFLNSASLRVKGRAKPTYPWIILLCLGDQEIDRDSGISAEE